MQALGSEIKGIGSTLFDPEVQSGIKNIFGD